MSYAPSVERSAGYHLNPDDECSLVDDGISSLHDTAIEVFYDSNSQNPAEIVFDQAGTIEVVAGSNTIRYQYQPVDGAIPPRVKSRSLYRDINHDRELYRELTAASIETTDRSASLELMDSLPLDHHVFIKTTLNKENSCFVPWEHAITLDFSLGSPLAFLYLAHSIGHVVTNQARPELYAAYKSGMEMAFATTREFNADTLTAQRAAWKFAVHHLEPFMSDDTAAAYSRQQITAVVDRSLSWCRNVMHEELAHPFKATRKRLGRAALLTLAQSNILMDTKMTPIEEARIARILGYEIQ